MNQIRWPNWLFSNNSFNEYSRLISFRIDWFDLLALQVTFKSLLQNHNSKASILQLSVFCRVHLSHLYTTTGKTIALTIWIFVRKQSLLLNMLPRFVIAFHPRSNSLSILWLQSPSWAILEPKKIKPVTASTFSPYIYHEVMGQDAMILVFWMLFSHQLFHSPLSPSSKGSLAPLHFLPLEWYHLHTWVC